MCKQPTADSPLQRITPLGLRAGAASHYREVVFGRDRAVYIAGLALALAIYAVARGPRTEPCVDLQARDQLGALRRELAQRDATIQRLTRAPDAPATVAAPAPAPADREPRFAPSPEPAQRRFARFETANPAVHVTQNADGGYDIQNTDPSLAGSVVEVTAVAPSGDQTKVLIRIPQ
jgi:hypothetical protein